MKKSFIYIAIFVLLVVLVWFNAAKVSDDRQDNTSDPEISTGFFDKFNENDAKDIENSIRDAEKERFEQFGGATQKEIEETLLKLENGEISLRQIFADTFIAGDSLINGLEIYGVLGSENIASQVSASLDHLSDNIIRIISANPQELILHYGINVISTEKSQLESFITSYAKIILQIKNQLPETRIIVSGLFPVDTSVATEDRFAMVASYNNALVKMCETIKVEFLDSTKAFEGNASYYGDDGIHVSPEFYSEIWLPFIIENKGIIG